MDYSHEYLEEYLPREGPPVEYIPNEVLDEINLWISSKDVENAELVARSTKWTYAIFSEYYLGNFTLNINNLVRYDPYGFSHFAQLLHGGNMVVGLYDKEQEEPGFGICLNIQGWDRGEYPPGDIFKIGAIRFSRLRQSFPIAIRRVRTELHAPPNPANATTSCWAKCNRNHSWGIITAGRAIRSNTAGQLVGLDNKTQGSINRSYWPPIDAAFISTKAPVKIPNLIKIANFPAAGMGVDVQCKKKTKGRTVKEAGSSLGFYKSRRYPVLFHLDKPCSPGDSGALVRLHSGLAGGIYLASQPAPDIGSDCGLVQNFAQAMFALDTAAYL